MLPVTRYDKRWRMAFKISNILAKHFVTSLVFSIEYFWFLDLNLLHPCGGRGCKKDIAFKGRPIIKNRSILIPRLSPRRISQNFEAAFFISVFKGIPKVVSTRGVSLEYLITYRKTGSNNFFSNSSSGQRSQGGHFVDRC